MINKNFEEAFEKTKIAGSIAAGALDQVNQMIKPGVTTDQIDRICYEYINDIKLTLLHYFIEAFQSLVVHLPIMLFVTVYRLTKF